MDKSNLKVGDFVSLYEYPGLSKDSKLPTAVLYLYSLTSRGQARVEHVLPDGPGYGGRMATAGRFTGREWSLDSRYLSNETLFVYKYKLEQGIIKHPDKENLIKILNSDDIEGQQFAVEILKNYK